MNLIGFVDGVEVKFDFCPPNTFKGEIPVRVDGKYVLQLKLLDDAGNEATYSNVYVRINFQKMLFSMLPIAFKEIDDYNNLKTTIVSGPFSVKEVPLHMYHENLVITMIDDSFSVVETAPCTHYNDIGDRFTFKELMN